MSGSVQFVSSAEMGAVVCNDCGEEALTLIVERDDSHTYERIECACGHLTLMPAKQIVDWSKAIVFVCVR